MKHQRGQSTAEYAILIGVVIGALVAMQTYVKRGQQGRLKAVVDSYTAGDVTDGAGVSITRTLGQYEPYYQESSFKVGRASETRENIDLTLTTGNITKTLTTARPETTVRRVDGHQTQLRDEQRD